MTDRERRILAATFYGLADDLEAIVQSLGRVGTRLRRAARLLAPPADGPADDVGPGAVDPRYWLMSPDGSQLLSADTPRGLGCYADRLRDSGAVGVYPIYHRGTRWGSLTVESAAWRIEGPDGFRDAPGLTAPTGGGS